MLPKTVKNKSLFARVLLWALLLCAPLQAYAYQLGAQVPSPISIYGTGVVCPVDPPDPGIAAQYGWMAAEQYGLARRVIPCVRDNILEGTNNILVPFANFINYAVLAACTLAVALYGLLLISGRVTAVRDGMALAIKLIFVSYYAFNFAGFFQLYLWVMDSLLGIVGSYAYFSSNWNCPVVFDPPDLAVWDNVDCAIETLVGGVFSPFTLTGGLIGFLVACLFSNAAGVFIALMGFILIAKFLYAIARALYIYVTAYIAVAIMVLISPIFVPMILFSATRSYFEKWFKMTLSFMLQPVILFAYLAMLLLAFDTIVYTGPTSLYRAVVGDNNITGITIDDPAFTVPWDQGGIGGVGGWLQMVGAYGEESQGGHAMAIDIGQITRDPNLGKPESLQSGVMGQIGQQVIGDSTAWKNDIFNYLGLGNANDLKFFKVDIPTTGIAWDWLAYINDDYVIDSDGYVDPTQYVVNLFITAMMALVTGYIFLLLLDYLPYISSGLANKPIGIDTFGKGRMAPPGGKFMEDLKSKLATAGAKP